MLGGMAIIRRLTVGIGAALLVGGWGMCGYAKEHDLRRRIESLPHTTLWDRDFGKTYRYGVAAMAVGAGLMGFAVLRPYYPQR